MDKYPRISSSTPSLLIGAAALVIVVAGMRAAETIIVPFLLSVFLAITSAPPLAWLERKGLPRVLALLVVIAGVIGVLMVLGAIISSSVDGFTRNLPLYQARLQQLSAGALGWLGQRGITLAQAQVAKYLDPNAIFRLVANTLNGLGGVLGNAALILLTVLFMLLETTSFPLKLRVILGSKDSSLEQFYKLTENVKRYLAIKTGTSLATGVAVAISLSILGVDFPVLWGLLAFMLNYVPNIGAIIAAAPAILLALIQLGVGSAVWTGIAYLVIGNVIGNVIEPRLMGRSLGLSTLVVFISLVFWGWVLGPLGMFLSVPLTMTFKIAMESDARTRWVAVLLGTEVDAQTLLPETLAPGASATAAQAGPGKDNRAKETPTLTPSNQPDER